MACPVCGESDRNLLHADLQDRVFFCAAGRWMLQRCAHCFSAYLDPRPTRETIGLAYQHYYTHEATPTGLESPRSLSQWWKKSKRNDYLQSAFGYRPRPRLPGGRFVLSSRRRYQIDRWIRHLPAPAGHGARLLDVGCGNGSFLKQMRQLGWAVVGIEPDASAVAVATTGGLEVHQGCLDEGFAATEPFDAITLGHVVEHLHDPARTLRLCFDILRPGGLLWISTPNLQSTGYKRFGPSWRGLEPPRHLVIFTPGSLQGLLERIGFVEITQPRPDEAAEWFYLTSAATAHGLKPERWSELARPLKRELRAAARQANQQLEQAPETAEELVLLARKPAS